MEVAGGGVFAERVIVSAIRVPKVPLFSTKNH